MVQPGVAQPLPQLGATGSGPARVPVRCYGPVHTGQNATYIPVISDGESINYYHSNKYCICHINKDTWYIPLPLGQEPVAGSSGQLAAAGMMMAERSAEGVQRVEGRRRMQWEGLEGDMQMWGVHLSS